MRSPSNRLSPHLTRASNDVRRGSTPDHTTSIPDGRGCVLHPVTRAETTLRRFPSTFSKEAYQNASADLKYRPVMVWSPSSFTSSSSSFLTSPPISSSPHGIPLESPALAAEAMATQHSRCTEPLPASLAVATTLSPHGTPSSSPPQGEGGGGVGVAGGSPPTDWSPAHTQVGSQKAEDIAAAIGKTVEGEPAIPVKASSVSANEASNPSSELRLIQRLVSPPRPSNRSSSFDTAPIPRFPAGQSFVFSNGGKRGGKGAGPPCHLMEAQQGKTGRVDHHPSPRSYLVHHSRASSWEKRESEKRKEKKGSRDPVYASRDVTPCRHPAGLAACDAIGYREDLPRSPVSPNASKGNTSVQYSLSSWPSYGASVVFPSRAAAVVSVEQAQRGGRGDRSATLQDCSPSSCSPVAMEYEVFPTTHTFPLGEQESDAAADEHAAHSQRLAFCCGSSDTPPMREMPSSLSPGPLSTAACAGATATSFWRAKSTHSYASTPPFVLLQNGSQLLKSEQLHETVKEQEAEAFRRILGDKRDWGSPSSPSLSSPPLGDAPSKEKDGRGAGNVQSGMSPTTPPPRVSCVKEVAPPDEGGSAWCPLSDAAKLLFSTVLYLRAVGGLPTLLRVGPLTQRSAVVDKENCIELVFFNAVPLPRRPSPASPSPPPPSSSSSVGAGPSSRTPRNTEGNPGHDGVGGPPAVGMMDTSGAPSAFPLPYGTSLSEDAFHPLHTLGGGASHPFLNLVDPMRATRNPNAGNLAEQDASLPSSFPSTPSVACASPMALHHLLSSSPSSFSAGGREGGGTERGALARTAPPMLGTTQSTSTSSPSSPLREVACKEHSTGGGHSVRKKKGTTRSPASPCMLQWRFFGAEKCWCMAPHVNRIHRRGLRTSCTAAGYHSREHQLMGFASAEDHQNNAAEGTGGNRRAREEEEDEEHGSTLEPWNPARCGARPGRRESGRHGGSAPSGSWDPAETPLAVGAATSGGTSFRHAPSRSYGSPSEKRGEEKHQGIPEGFNTPYIEEKEEICVIVRAVLAIKTTVYRFGASEVVHVLPPLPRSNPAHQWQGKGEMDKGSAVARLLRARQEKGRKAGNAGSGGGGQGTSRVGGGGGYGVSGTTSIKMGEDGQPLPPDYGDLVVAFLQTPGELPPVSCLPSVEELESLRYRIFALQGLLVEEHGEYRDEEDGSGGREGGQDVHLKQKKKEWEGRRDEPSRERLVPTVRVMGIHGQEEDVSRAALVARFPLYQAASVGEQAWKGTDVTHKRVLSFPEGTRWRCGGVGVEDTFSSLFEKNDQKHGLRGFEPMNLQKFYMNFLESIQYALTVQVQKTKEKVEYALNEF